ncbi:hypothetical protein [Micromonospora sp. RP3T]|uniref:hypothetical protein n=1 Tax=Micromonospora sp. RP3T TaxID=2135446 RepID=UPI003D72B638
MSAGPMERFHERVRSGQIGIAAADRHRTTGAHFLTTDEFGQGQTCGGQSADPRTDAIHIDSRQRGRVHGEQAHSRRHGGQQISPRRLRELGDCRDLTGDGGGDPRTRSKSGM